MNAPLIESKSLTVSYHYKPVLWNLDFELPRGKMIGIIGPNGSGKTTFLKTLMGLLKPDSGSVKIFGQSPEAARKLLSYVPQRESVDWDFPARVQDVVLMGRYKKSNLFGRLSKEDHRIAEEAMAEVGLKDFAKRQIGELSGGQQQRVFLARAIARQPELFLMDEPFAGVDAATEDAILRLLTRLRDRGKSVVIVHHDLQTAQRFFDHLVLLRTRLIASGPTEEVLTPEHLDEAYGGRLDVLSRMGDLLRKNRSDWKDRDLNPTDDGR